MTDLFLGIILGYGLGILTYWILRIDVGRKRLYIAPKPNEPEPPTPE